MKNEGNPNHDKKTGQFTSKNGGGSAEANKEKQKPLSANLEKIITLANEKLADKQPIAEIKGDEFEGKTLKEKRDNARKYFEKNLRNKEFENKSLNKKIKILSGDKSFSQMGYEDKVNSIKYLPEILENGIHVRSEKETKGRGRINSWHYLIAKLTVGNKENNESKERLVGLTILRDDNGNFYYNHHLQDIKKEER
jgi:hypothetical protein